MPYTTNYDYEDDSDLEEGYYEDFSDEDPVVAPRERLGNNPPKFVSIENSDPKTNGSSDIISVSDLDSLFSEPVDMKDGTEFAHLGKIVVIEDVAFVT
jgi:hypothetical protein